MTKSKIKPTISQVIHCLKAESERYPEVCEECPLYGETGCDHCYDDVTDMAIKSLKELEQYRAIGTVKELKSLPTLCKSLEESCKVAEILIEELKQYRAIGTVEECRTAVERMKAMNVNDSMITLGLYFEIHDADLYGGEGSVGYANINADLKVSALAKADVNSYVESQRQGFAEMCKVDKGKVIVISRVDYEERTDEEDDCGGFEWSE